jgi:hypothetical protein
VIAAASPRQVQEVRERGGTLRIVALGSVPHLEEHVAERFLRFSLISQDPYTEHRSTVPIVEAA